MKSGITELGTPSLIVLAGMIGEKLIRGDSVPEAYIDLFIGAVIPFAMHLFRKFRERNKE